MTAREFVYWLQGFYEMAKPDAIDRDQTEMIRRHLGLVFIHEIDPSYGDDQEALNEAHNDAALKTLAEKAPKVSDLLKPRKSQDDQLYRC
jgi:hypothetical protein